MTLNYSTKPIIDTDILIVGAGFSGAVIAERIANDLGKRCVVIDKRKHIGGNCYDKKSPLGILTHQYGPHYFRTNSERVKKYVESFAEFRPTNYKLMSWTKGRYWSFPINLKTFEQLIGRRSSEVEFQNYLNRNIVSFDNPKNSEEVVLSKAGSELYNLFFKNYTEKQWGKSAKKLLPEVCARVPIRTNRDDKYLKERHQIYPVKGYTNLFESLLKSPKIRLLLDVDYFKIRRNVKFKHCVYTGKIDDYFDLIYGKLDYRSLKFESVDMRQDYYQPALQVNYPNEYRYTRTVEYKHLSDEHFNGTTVVFEFPENYTANGEPYYPMMDSQNREKYKKYKNLKEALSDHSFVGRLAQFKYFNMDQVIASALTEYERIKKKFI